MRIRIIFHKTEAMRFTGHLDLHQTWERIFRRAGLPLAYSQGFHPQPRINLACALPLGFTSECEVLDVWLEQELTIDDFLTSVSQALPPGIKIEDAENVDIRLPSLQTQVASAVFNITFLDPIPDLGLRITNLLKESSIPRQRNGKDYDLRPLIEDIHELEPDVQNHTRWQIQMAARSGATGRPEEFVAALDMDPYAVRVHRIRLIFQPTTLPA